VLPAAHAKHFKRLPTAALSTFELAPKGRLAHSLVMARQVRQIVREWQPDVVHLHSSFAGLFVRPWLALRPHRPRVVYCAHGWAFDRRVSAASNRVSATIERCLSAASDAIVCVSQADRRTALSAGIADRRLVVIPNGIRDLDAPLDTTAARARWPEGCRRLLFVGRLDDQKGIDILAEVLRGLGEGVFAVIVGAPVVGGQMPDLPANCVVTGWLAREDIAALYAAAEVLVMPSRWEGLPIVAIEAQRAGLPVVSSAVGGLTEVVDPGVNGELVPSNAAADFVRVLSQLDDATLARMRAHARRSFETRFRIERVVERLDTAYRGAVPA
jgi:glycosyltransferase involved in cell wall biosynthesis